MPASVAQDNAYVSIVCDEVRCAIYANDVGPGKQEETSHQLCVSCTDWIPQRARCKILTEPSARGAVMRTQSSQRRRTQM